MPNPFFKESAPHGVAELGVQGARRAERDLIGAQGFKEDSGLRNELLIVQKPLDRDGGVENNPHALMRFVSKLAQVRKRPWKSAVLGPDLIAKGLDASEERVLGLGPGLSGESLDEILHPVLKRSWEGLDFLEEFRGAHSVLGRAILQRSSEAPDTSSRGLGLRLGRPHPLDELRQHLNATDRQRASAEALRGRRQATQSENVGERRAFSRRASRDPKVVATLPTRDPAAPLREVQNHRETGALELIAENAIYGGDEGVRHALEF